MPTWFQWWYAVLLLVAVAFTVSDRLRETALSLLRRTQTEAEIATHVRTEDAQDKAIVAMQVQLTLLSQLVIEAKDAAKKAEQRADVAEQRVSALEAKVESLEAQKLANATKIANDESEIAGLKNKLAQAERTAKRWQDYVLVLVELMRAAGIAVPPMEDGGEDAG